MVRVNVAKAWVEVNQGKYLCECGCGEPVKLLEKHYYSGIIPKRIYDHRQPYGTLEERFWRNVKKIDDENSCWEWQGSMGTNTGYGEIQIDGQRTGTHRASWIIHHGSIPKGMDICHKCDNRKCTRISHLFISDAEGNMDDCAKKGRAAKKLNGEKAKQIVEMYNTTDKSMEQIAAEFNVSHCTVGSITRGETWSHFTGIPKPDKDRVKRKRLTGDDAKEIADFYYSSGWSSREVGNKFGVSKTLVLHIANGKIWSHFTGIEKS